MNLRVEELSLGGWPALQTLAYDGWLLRFAEGYTKRSNSVSPLYPSAIAPGEKIRVCEDLYAGRGLPTIFKLLDEGEGNSLDGVLEGRGYLRLDESSVRVRDLSGFPAEPKDGIKILDSFSENWIDAFCTCSGAEARRAVIGRILGNVLCPVIVAAKAVDGGIAGCGYGAVDRGHVGIFDIVVRQEFRGRGYGEQILRSILGRAAAMGALRAYLQVISGNVPAEGLYDKLGFREAYRYWYRKRG
jgi:N-acetylglutamate synthase